MAGRAHMPQLDGLRALAVAAVLVQHTTPDAWHGGLPGAGGVWLFFVLSGFLITGILMKERSEAAAAGYPMARVWRSFWARRALRIFPLYYAVLLFAAALGIGRTRADWPWFASYAANIRLGMPGHFWVELAHFWSLCVEEQFYLAWPVACLWLPRRWLLPLAWAGVAIAPASRLLLFRAGYYHLANYAPTSCLDGLGIGAALALSGRAPRAHAAIAGAALVAACVALRAAALAGSVRLALSRLGWSLLSWWLVGRAAGGFAGPFGRLLECRPVRYVGRISYGVYVLHAAVPWVSAWSRYRLGTSLGYPAEAGAGQLAYVSAMTLLIAGLSWRYFEEPILRLKRFVPYVGR